MSIIIYKKTALLEISKSVFGKGQMLNIEGSISAQLLKFQRKITQKMTAYFSNKVPPKMPPKIQGLDEYYRIGDLVEINCTSKESKPAAKITWTLNGEKVRL